MSCSILRGKPSLSSSFTQSTCESQNTCACGDRSTGPTKLARVTCSSPAHRSERKNRVEPQREQKPRSPWPEDRYQTRWCCGSSIRHWSASSPTQVTKAEPLLRWHIVQWQCATHLLGSCAVNWMSPHRQRPVAGFMARLLADGPANYALAGRDASA